MMKRIFLVLLTLSLFSCNNQDAGKPATALDAGRQFIRASLDGDFAGAESLLMKDSQNVQLFQRYESFYTALPQEQKKSYKQASYEINKFEDLNDSVTIINYSNTYMNKPMEIKVVKEQGDWKIDFKFTSTGNLPIE